MTEATTSARGQAGTGDRAHHHTCERSRAAWVEGSIVALGVAALAATTGPALFGALPPEAATPATAPVAQTAASNKATSAARRGASGGTSSALAHRGWTVGAYGGVADTLDSSVRIVNPGRTDLTVSNFPWLGRPFKAPPYYGVRAQRWSGDILGGMLDFTHAKAIGKTEASGTFKGTHNGQSLPGKARMTDVFRNFEFSHGHNMVTLNGMLRGMAIVGLVRPYIGAGAGVSLPHTEIGFKADNARTYQYQYAGLVGQALVGLEWRIGPATVFMEYKYSYAPYDVPLSQTFMGQLLFTDLWRQFSAWSSGEPPPGGRLTTVLRTHHGIAGVLYNVPGPLPAAQ